MKFSLPFEIKASEISGTGEFTGYAAAFGNEDLAGDVIVPGAFKATLVEQKQRNAQPALLWSHDPSLIIGKLTELHEDQKGLFAAAKLTLGTRVAAEAYALLKDGAVGGMSIGYNVAPGGAESGDGGARLLKQLDLYEVSLVAVPCNSEARVTGVKSLEHWTPRAIEHVLRDKLSFTAREAKMAASALWPLLNDRDGHEADRDDRTSAQITELASELRSLTDFAKGFVQ